MSPRHRPLRLLAGALTAALAAVLAPAAPVHAAASCSVDYEVADEWGGGFTAAVTVVNGDEPVSGWSLGWTFPDGQQITNGWNGAFSQEGDEVTVSHPGWNPDLDPGEAASFGFQASLTGANGAPTGFTLNGTPCDGEGDNTPPEVALTAPEDGAALLADDPIALAAEASDADGEVERVVFQADGTEIGADDTAPYTADWSGAEPGRYSLTATAVDDQGAATTSAPVAVQVLAEPEVTARPSSVSVRQGGTASFELELSTAPEDGVQVEVARTGGSEDITVAGGASLSFGPDDWDEPQEVTVASADNGGDPASAVLTASAEGYGSAEVEVTEIEGSASDYDAAFLEQYDKIKDPDSGYFRAFDGLLVPYHSVETLIVEAPDHGHATTSEAFSYYLWLEAAYGRATGDWEPFTDAWASLEEHIVPGTEDQPTNAAYDPSSPATYIPEQDEPQGYPSALDQSVPTGEDPLAEELSGTYGTDEVYGMHWLLDVDNTYGYGFCGDGSDDAPGYINTFQRGSQESVWETVPHPSCETYAHGGENGFLDLFTDDQQYSQQWRYTNAPDADARAVQVAHLAQTWAEEQGNAGAVAGVVDDAARMGDYLRYAMYDKYFKRIGDCAGEHECPGGQGKNSAHYLMSWYYSWGGAMESAQYPWAWRIGGSSAHQGYQNPMAAYALSETEALTPASPTAAEDWATSMDRQLEFVQWLQSAEGGIAGGATNSWAGRYADPPEDAARFYGMYYDWQPVWHDPPSNNWFGFQVWNMERIAQLYSTTGDERAGEILDAWVPWALENTEIGTGGEFAVPSDLEWSGRPDDWTGSPTGNPDLHVEVASHGQDVGVAAGLAKTLMHYAAGSGDSAARTAAEGLLDALLEHRDDLGIAVEETRADYARFDDEVYIPQGWSGEMANGDPVGPGATFTSIRSFYRDDPQWPKVEAYLEDPDGPAPSFTYHRFWSQTEIATAFAVHDELFG
ncbi:glycoside hydrolase family 48 protein [Nocardiopsis suaedae]|uniref:Cellulose binding domain-containing protein n=1 Tax=Nocardiopsis suaedae TaxID=3018444 RepID=A0ABT4TSQ8_9ACTN|nr:glycoside hydrolase family 48 protein [Nocardiopsis suaedae]MDA2807697.1 cellulose binding domain-containing protein [Nocardiopsis suaedae]